MAERYRVHCTAGEIDSLPAGVEIEKEYPAFVIARVPDRLVADLKSRFPLEALGSAKPPPAVQAVAAVANAAATAPGRGPYTVAVRFDRPAADVADDCFECLGAEMLRPIGSRTVVVRCPNKDVLAKVEKLENVEQVQHFVPSVRLSPGFFVTPPPGEVDVAEAMEAAEPPKSKDRVLAGLVNAHFLTSEDRDRAERRLKRRGVKHISPYADRGLTIDLVTDPDRLAAVQEIIALDGLERIEERRLNRYFNDVARQIIGDGVFEPPPDGLGLDGTGEIVAVADSGLDTGHADTIHADFRGRVRDIQSLPITPAFSGLLVNPGGDDGASDRFSGHGTHVAGSVLGNGARTTALGLPPVQGSAPGAELVFQAIDQSMQWSTQGIITWLQQFGQQPPSHGLFGIPDDLAELFQPAYDQGARIHSNSWGGGAPGVYDDQCRALDEFVWHHRDLLVVVAAGNDGADKNPVEGIDPGSISSPAVAKNCLSVGASENRRPDKGSRYRDFWPDKYPRPPYDEDPLADEPDDVAAFSSRGPCATGRRKPDVVAPGTFVLSTRSSQIASNNFAWGSFPPAKKDYMYMGGTSMATPLVSGCAAVLRQYLRQERGIENPSAALLKAALVHSARYLPYRFPAPASTPFADDEQGWGRVELASLLTPGDGIEVRFVDHGEAQAEGEMFETEIEVASAETPLRATLVYTDFPGEDLINNLNLFLFDPEGKHHLGNDFEGQGIPDGLNNVEGVVIANPTPGTWLLRVVASAVPVGPQDFALVVSAGVGE